VSWLPALQVVIWTDNQFKLLGIREAKGYCSPSDLRLMSPHFVHDGWWLARLCVVCRRVAFAL